MPKYEALPMLDSSSEILAAIDAMVQTPTPGFQIDPRTVSLATALARVTEGMQPYLPGFALNTHSPKDGINFNISEADAHIDIDQVDSGVAVHINKGLGSVTLRLTRFGTERVGNQFHFLGIRKKIVKVGPLYSGDLFDGVMTVFLEGIATDAARLGPALHRYRARQGVKRGWQRYTFNPNI